jgi:hypothetical protein
MDLLLSGCAWQPPYPTAPDDAAHTATSYGAPSATQPAAEARPAGRTRAEVHAEAVEAVKHYKPTMQTDREYYTK